MTGQGSQLFNQLLNFGTGVMNDPSAGLQPIQQAGMEQINSSYGNIPQVISASMAKRGYGSSGSMGDAMYKAQLARLGSQSQFQGQMANLSSQRQFQAGGLMDDLLRTQIGSTGTSKTTTMDPFQSLMGLGSLIGMGIGGVFGGGVTGDMPTGVTPGAGAGSMIDGLMGGGGY